MATVSVNGISLYYEVHGAGEPVVMIMGLGASAIAWDAQVPVLSKEYQLITFDNRGAGRSDKPSDPYSISMMADDTAALMGELGIASAHIFGMSMGGMIAQEMHHRHRERVRTLVLAGTTSGGPMATLPSPSFFSRFLSRGGSTMEDAVLDGLRVFYSDRFIEENKERLVRRALEHMSLMPPGYALQRQVMAVMGFNAHSRLPRIDVPTLVLGATEDKIVPFPNQQQLAKRIPEARFVPFEGAGHGFLMERATAVNRAVLDFLGEHNNGFAGAK